MAFIAVWELAGVKRVNVSVHVALANGDFQ